MIFFIHDEQHFFSLMVSQVNIVIEENHHYLRHKAIKHRISFKLKYLCWQKATPTAEAYLEKIPIKRQWRPLKSIRQISGKLQASVKWKNLPTNNFPWESYRNNCWGGSEWKILKDSDSRILSETNDQSKEPFSILNKLLQSCWRRRFWGAL